MIFCKNSFYHKFVLLDILKIGLSALTIAAIVVPFNLYVNINIWFKLAIDLIMGACIYGLFIIISREYVGKIVLNSVLTKVFKKKAE